MHSIKTKLLIFDRSQSSEWLLNSLSLTAGPLITDLERWHLSTIPGVPRNPEANTAESLVSQWALGALSGLRGAGRHSLEWLSLLREWKLLSTGGHWNWSFCLWAGHTQNCLQREILTSPQALVPPLWSGKAVLALMHELFQAPWVCKKSVRISEHSCPESVLAPRPCWGRSTDCVPPLPLESSLSETLSLRGSSERSVCCSFVFSESQILSPGKTVLRLRK